MDVENLIDSIGDLSDLELAVLLCLTAKEHCLVTTENELVEDLASELALIVSEIFSLSYRVLSLEDLQNTYLFGEKILDSSNDLDAEAHLSTIHNNEHVADIHSRLAAINMQSSSQLKLEPTGLDTRMVANVVIAKNFDLAHRDVQIQALELIRRRRIYSRTTVHLAPNIFLFLPIVSTSANYGKLNVHLNDSIYMSHHHTELDSFPNLAELPHKWQSSDQESVEDQQYRHIDTQVVDKLRHLGMHATLTPEIRRYLQDIIVFLRLERGLDSGVTPSATTSVVSLAKYLAPLHGIEFVTPSLVALAIKKVYPHRIVISSPERDRSTLYGSTLESVRKAVEGMTPESIIEAVLAKVEAPL